MLLSSDGLTEAHSPDREMLGVPRVIDTIAARPEGESLIGVVLSELDNWTGPDWEQEDDVTSSWCAAAPRPSRAPAHSSTGATGSNSASSRFPASPVTRGSPWTAWPSG